MERSFVESVSASALVATAPASPPPGGAPVPEPGTLLLVGTGLVGFALTARRRRPRTE